MVDYLIMRGQQKGLLFFLPDGTMRTRHLLASAPRIIIRSLNLFTQLYNTHSFRIGAATSANRAGLTSYQINALDKWQNDAYQRYIRLSPKQGVH